MSSDDTHAGASTGRDKGRPGDAVAVAGLAATLAALDPARTAWRNDILISAILEVLSRRTHMSSGEIRRELRQLWISTSMPLPSIEAALLEAAAADLVTKTERANAEAKWRITPDAKEHVLADQRRANELLQRLKSDVADRLGVLLSEQPSDEKAGRLTRQLVSAMASASHLVFDAVRSSGSPQDLRAVRLSLRDLRDRILEDVSPPDQAEALAQLAWAAADPSDEFGDDVLRLIVSGQVLHGLVARRDVPPGHSLRGSLLVLDTTCLLMSVESTPTDRQAFAQLLEVAGELGCRVFVTEAVLHEWEEQWHLADTQEPEALATRLPEVFGSLVASQIIRGYIHEHRSSGADWRAFCRRFRNVRQRLLEAGAEVGEGEPDDTVAASVERELLRLTDERPLSHGRRPAAAAVDGRSAGIVAASRRASALQHVLPAAWFVVGRERLTAEAYANVVPSDSFPLSATPTSWMLFAAAYEGREIAVADLAQSLSEAVIMDAFLTVASSYSADELVSIAGALGDIRPDRAVAADLVRSSFATDSGTTDPEARAADLIRRRGLRASRSAARDVEEAARRQAEAEARALDAESRALTAEATTPIVLSDGERRWRRRALVIAVVLGGVVGALLVKIVVGASWVALAPAAIALVLTAFLGLQFAESDERALKFWASTAVAVVLTFLPSLHLPNGADRHKPGATDVPSSSPTTQHSEAPSASPQPARTR